MKEKSGDIFDAKAATWDEDPFKVKLANDIADTIIREMAITKHMDILDYGCGSGLVTLRLQPLAGTVTGMDSSRGMLEVLQGKIERQGLRNVKTRLADLEEGFDGEDKFHLIVSSMTLHHIHEPGHLFARFFDLLLPGGYVAIADLDSEDGSFHQDNAGVVHFGFDRSRLKGSFLQAGFGEVRDLTAARVRRVVADGGEKEFPIFLVIAGKPGV